MRKSIGIYSRDSRTDKQFRNSWKEAISDSGSQYHSILRRNSGLLFVIYILRDRILKRKILAFGVTEALILILFRPDAIIITGFGRLLDKYSRVRKIIFFIFKLIYKNIPVIVLNKHDFRIFLKLGFNKVHLIPGEGYISRRSSVSDVVIDSVRSVNLLYIGRLLKSKGVNELVEYFEYLKANFRSPVTLTLIGDTDFGSSDAIDIQNAKQKHGSHLQHINYTQDIGNFLNENYIFISLSKREGLSFSVLEALDAGCSAILSHVPGNAEFHGYNRVRTVRNKNDLFNLTMQDIIEMKNESKSDLSKFQMHNVKTEIQKILVCISIL